MRKISVFIFISMLICSSAYAGRPLSVEDATVAGKGALEAEISAEYARQDNKDNSYTFSFMPVYGLTQNLEFSVELPLNVISPKEDPTEGGLGDIALVLKTLIFPETEKIPAFLLKTGVKLATGDEGKGLGSGDEDIDFTLAVTKTIGPFTMHGNIGYAFVGKGRDSTLNDYLLYGIALEYSIKPKLSLASEIYGESDSHFDTGAFEHHSINPLIGLTYQLTEKMAFDAAFRIGIQDEGKAEYGIISGISIAF